MNSLAVGALVVLAALGVIWSLVLIPVLLELRQASQRLQEFIRTVELELRPMLQEAREGIRTVGKAGQGASDSIARLQGTLGALEEAGENIRVTTGVVRTVFGSRLIPVAGLLAGLRVGVKTLLRQYARRREQS